MRRMILQACVVLALLGTGGTRSRAGSEALDHMRQLIDRAVYLSGVSDVRDHVPAEDLDFVKSTAVQAGKHLDAEQYAAAWQLLTHWRFWTLVNDVMRPHEPEYAWLVAAPFPVSAGSAELEEDVLAGVVAEGRAYRGAPQRGKPVTAAWQRTLSRMKDGRQWVDMGALCARHDAVGYAYTAVYSPETRQAQVDLASANSVRLWVNGETVFDKEQEPGEQAWVAQAQADLQKGWNPVLARLERGDAAWGFGVRFADAQGNALPGLDMSERVLMCGEYSVLFKGAELEMLWWQGEPWLKTHYYHFNGADAKTRKNVGKWRLNTKPMTLHSNPDGSRTLTWEGFPDLADKYFYLRQTVQLLPHRVVLEYQYETRADMYPHFWTDDPARSFNRDTCRYQAKMFYLLLHSTSPMLWNTEAVVSEEGGQARTVRIPERQPDSRVNLASAGYDRTTTVTFQTPLGRFSYTPEARRMDDMQFYCRAYKYHTWPEPLWIFGIDDSVFYKMDIVPAGYSNTVTVTLELGLEADTGE